MNKNSKGKLGQLGALSLLVFAASMIACVEAENTRANCDYGQVASCQCSDGTQSQRLCVAGSWQPCSCEDGEQIVDDQVVSDGSNDQTGDATGGDVNTGGDEGNGSTGGDTTGGGATGGGATGGGATGGGATGGGATGGGATGGTGTDPVDTSCASASTTASCDQYSSCPCGNMSCSAEAFGWPTSVANGYCLAPCDTGNPENPCGYVSSAAECMRMDEAGTQLFCVGMGQVNTGNFRVKLIDHEPTDTEQANAIVTGLNITGSMGQTFSLDLSLAYTEVLDDSSVVAYLLFIGGDAYEQWVLQVVVPMSQWYSGANLKLAASEADAPMSFSGTLQHMFFSGDTTTGAWIEGVAVGTDDNVTLSSVNSPVVYPVNAYESTGSFNMTLAGLKLAFVI